MQTLSMLNRGQLNEATRIKISENLTTFPDALFDLSHTLEVLDLSGNQLSQLPEKFEQFQQLRILFLSSNQFEHIPPVLARCPRLSMIGFKSNRITSVAADCLPDAIRWLILTDNQITTLPQNLGQYQKLQKVMLAGNQLTHLPDSMADCHHLELLRLSANQLQTLPDWLLALPRLAWLALAGNPCLPAAPARHTLKQINWQELQLKARLGEGASGIIHQADWQHQQPVAVKCFKGHVTSDGWPEDEKRATVAAAQHPNLIEVLGQLQHHPEHRSGLVFSLISPDYTPLAAPPSLQSCTRDVYAQHQQFSDAQIQKIAGAIASVAQHLHQRQIMHGDLYAHNILINQIHDCLLGDFGAATLYQGLPLQQQHALQRLEVRAFGCLLEELLQHQHPPLNQPLHQLQHACCQPDVRHRPDFQQIITELQHNAA